jgi:hypothetical protein
MRKFEYIGDEIGKHNKNGKEWVSVFGNRSNINGDSD